MAAFPIRAKFPEVRSFLTPETLCSSFLYWDLRPSARFPTVEFRVADVCTRVDDAVMLAGLCRSLVRTAARAADNDAEPVDHALEDSGEWELLSTAVKRVLAEGNGSDRQRQVYAETGNLFEVARMIADVTLAESSGPAGSW